MSDADIVREFILRVLKSGELIVKFLNENTGKSERYVVAVCKYPNEKPVRRSKTSPKKTLPTGFKRSAVKK